MSINSPVSAEPTTASIIFNWLFALLVMSIGTVNFLWGNDTGYGMFVFLLSFLYLPLFTAWFRKFSGFTMPLWLKMVVGFLILWTALGVAELTEKMQLMINYFNN